MLAKGRELIHFTAMLNTYCLILRLYTSLENIPVQVKDGCRLLIKIIVFIEHFNVKEILVHGLYNSWKTFSVLYRSSTVHCAMNKLMRAVGCPTPTNTRLLNPPVERDVVYPVRAVTKQVVILPTEPTI